MIADTKEIARLYLTGMPGPAIAEHLGYGASTVFRALKAEGVDMRPHILPLDIEKIRAMHLDEGLSVKAIATALGCSRIAITGAMDRAGIPYRNRSDAMFTRMAKTTAEERMALTDAAHAACRGKTRTTAEKINHAKRVMTRRPSPIEAIFLWAFTAAELAPVREFAVGEFNIDFAFPELRIAIEIDPGQWHSTPRKAAIDSRKDAFLKGLGWEVMRWSGQGIRMSNAGLPALAAELVADLKRTRLDPAA